MGEYNEKNRNPFGNTDDESRKRALEAARKARRTRAEVLTMLKAGIVGPEELLYSDDEIVRRTRLFPFCKSVPNVGALRARRILVALDLREDRRVQGLGSRQRKILARVLTEAAAGNYNAALLESAQKEV